MAAVSLNSNLAALRAKRALNASSAELSSNLERLSSGKRINHASDDAAGLAVSSTLNATARIHTQAARNVNDGISFLNVADGATSARRTSSFVCASFRRSPRTGRSVTPSGSPSIRSRRCFRPNTGGFSIPRASTASVSSGAVM